MHIHHLSTFPKHGRGNWPHQDEDQLPTEPGSPTFNPAMTKNWRKKIVTPPKFRWKMMLGMVTLPETNIAPEKWCLEDYFPFWEGNFSGAMLNFKWVHLGKLTFWIQQWRFGSDDFPDFKCRWILGEPVVNFPGCSPSVWNGIGSKPDGIGIA